MISQVNSNDKRFAYSDLDQKENAQRLGITHSWHDGGTEDGAHSEARDDSCESTQSQISELVFETAAVLPSDKNA